MGVDTLFLRGDRARRESAKLVSELAALRELRMLERDLRDVTRKMASAMRCGLLVREPLDCVGRPRQTDRDGAYETPSRP